jgi:NADPH-dependent curcumin reductase CurA
VQERVGRVHDGLVKAGETVTDGLENASTVLDPLFQSSNTGKRVLRVAEDN